MGLICCPCPAAVQLSFCFNPAQQAYFSGAVMPFTVYGHVPLSLQCQSDVVGRGNRSISYSGSPFTERDNSCSAVEESFSLPYGPSWQFTFVSTDTQPGNQVASEKQVPHQASDVRKGSKTHSRSGKQSSTAYVPSLLLGDVFMPCSVTQLFRKHEDLDELFARSSGRSSRQHVSSKDRGHADQTDSHGNAQEAAGSHLPPGSVGTPTTSGRDAEAAPGKARRLPKSLASALPAHVQLLLRMTSQIEGKRLFFVSQVAADVIRECLVLDRYEEIMRARAQEEQQQQQVANKSSTSASAGGTQGLGQWVTALESWLQPRPGLNLLPRVRLPGSQHASPTTSQAPGTSNTRSSSKGQSSDSPSPAAGAGKAYQGRQAAANNIQAVIASSASGRGKGGASSTGGPGGPGASGPFDPSKDGPLTGPMLALPLLNSLSEQEWRAMEEAAVVAEAEQIKAAESGSSGGVGSKDKSEGESRARPAPVSHVGRVPLEAAFALITARPQTFDIVVTGRDARLARECEGHLTLLDLHSSTEDRWVLKVEDSDEEEESEDIHGTDARRPQPSSSKATAQQSAPHTKGDGNTAAGSAASGSGSSSQQQGRRSARRMVQELGDSDDLDDSEEEEGMALLDKTPVFQVPGVTLSLRSAAGQHVNFTPSFLSLSQLHSFVEAGKHLARHVWLTSRQAARERITRRVETLALTFSGLASAPPEGFGPATAAAAAASQAGEGEEEDEEGYGAPPESKQLLQELGEGRRGPLVMAPPAPPTGLGAVLSTCAVGVVCIACQAACSLGDLADRALLLTPLGAAAAGIPEHLAVRAGWLEDVCTDLSQANQAAGRLVGRGSSSSSSESSSRGRVRLRKPGDCDTQDSTGSSADGSAQTQQVADTQGQRHQQSHQLTPAAGASASSSQQAAGSTPGGAGSHQDSSSSTSSSRQSKKPRTFSEVAALASPQSQGGAAAAAAAAGTSSPPSQHPLPSSSTTSQAPTPAHASPSQPSSPSSQLQQEHQQSQQSGHNAAAPSSGRQQASAAVQGPVPSQDGATERPAGSSSSSSSSSPGHAKQQQHQQQQQVSRKKQRSQGKEAQQLESLPALSLLLQAAWAVLHDSRLGKGQLASSLARSWSKQAKLSVPSDGEIHLAVSLQAQPVPASTLISLPKPQLPQPPFAQQQQQQQGGSTADSSSNSSSGQGTAGSSPASGSPQEPSAAGPSTCEIGIHINMNKLTGAVGHDAPDALSRSATAARGLLLVGDLGLSKGDDEAPWRAPPLGFLNLQYCKQDTGSTAGPTQP